MIGETFRVALLNTLRIGPYDTPHLTNQPVKEWLIASRSGADGLYLTISDTSVSVDQADGSAPADLAEQNSIVAILAESSAERQQFLMLRHLPAGLAVPGRFFPADGAVELSLAGDGLRLVAFGRHAHSRGSLNGHVTLHDIPHPAPNAEGAINWHFAAEERPWPA